MQMDAIFKFQSQPANMLQKDNFLILSCGGGIYMDPLLNVSD